MKSSPSQNKQSPHYKGHRERLKARFQAAGIQGIADYELIEMILYLALPRGDVKPLAKDLLSRFGSLSHILQADERVLKDVKGIGDSAIHVIKLINSVAIEAAHEQIREKNVLSTWRQVVDYCSRSMVNPNQGQVRLLFLDTKSQLIIDELHQTGTIDQTALYPREVIRRALDLGATGLIIVHNHPSGDPSPSRSDIDITLDIQRAGQGVGVAIHDHIIIGNGTYTSLKTLGFL